MKRRIFAIGGVLAGMGGMAAIAAADLREAEIGNVPPAALQAERGAIVVSDDDGLERAIRDARGTTTIRLRPGDYSRLSVARLAEGARLTIEGPAGKETATVAGLDIAAKGPVVVRNLRVARREGEPHRDHLAFIRNSDGVTIENISFQSPVKDVDRGREYGLMIRNSSNVTVRDSAFSGMRYGIGMLGIRDLTIERNEFFDIQTDGIRGGGIDGLTIRSNILGRFTPKQGEHPDGIQLWSTNQKAPGRRITIRDNLVTRDGGGIVQGIFIRDTASQLPFEQVEVSGNLIVGAMYNGIAVSGAKGIVMEDNQVIAHPDQKSWISLTNTSGERVQGNRAMIFIKDRKRVAASGTNRINRPVKAIDATTVRQWIAARNLGPMAGRPYLSGYLERVSR